MRHMSFVKFALERGGSIHPLIIPSECTDGTGLMNPSILVDDDKIRVLIRHVNYTFYHSEKKIISTSLGTINLCASRE